MSREEQNKDSFETVQEIERSKSYSDQEKKYWTTRILLADMSASLAIIADCLAGHREKDNDNCNDCVFANYPEAAEPCCRCSNSHNSMWRARK